MIYSSRPPFNDDPQPYRQMMAFARAASRESASAQHAWVYDPRPEHSRPQHNPTNTLLAHFRMIDAGRGEYEDWLRDIDENPHVWVRRRGGGLALGSMVGYTDDEIDHARKVLTRLANAAHEKAPA